VKLNNWEFSYYYFKFSVICLEDVDQNLETNQLLATELMDIPYFLVAKQCTVLIVALL